MHNKPFHYLLFIIAFLLLALPTKAQVRVIDIENPKVKVFLPPKELANGKAVVALPGGGYSALGIEREGYSWAPFFNDLGYAYAVVSYRMPNGNPDIPMTDVRNAFKILADSAAQWKINPDSIGIMGSSAGGHLASTIATHQTDECKPAFQILFYPVVSLDESITHLGSRYGFIGKNPSQELVDFYSSEKQVSGSTPPAILLLCSDDPTVAPANSLRYYEALQSRGIPCAMFIYPIGGHGWGYRRSFPFHDNMISELQQWLKREDR